MSAQHTRGPWAFRQIDSDGLGYIEAGGRDIMHAGVTDRAPAENIANGHLTAAAPDLLEAAELAIAYDALLQSHAGPEAVLFEGDVAEIDAAYDRWIAAARAALAKARGDAS